MVPEYQAITSPIQPAGPFASAMSAPSGGGLTGVTCAPVPSKRCPGVLAWIQHDRAVLIELVKVTKRPETSWLADVRASCGRTVGPWCGDPAAGIGPGLRTCLAEDGAALLDLDGTIVLLGLAGRLPNGVEGTWVEFFHERESIAPAVTASTTPCSVSVALRRPTRRVTWERAGLSSTS